MERKRALIAGIVGGGIGGILGAWLGKSHAMAMGFNPYFIALLTGIASIGCAIIIVKIIK